MSEEQDAKIEQFAHALQCLQIHFGAFNSFTSDEGGIYFQWHEVEEKYQPMIDTVAQNFPLAIIIRTPDDVTLLQIQMPL